MIGATEQGRPPAGGYRWVVLGATLYIVLVNVGMTYFVGSALSPFFAKALGLDRQLLGGIFSLFTLLTGISGPAVAAGVERFGPRQMLFWGSVVIAIGAAAMGLVVTTGFQALVAYGVIVGLGTGAGGLIAGQTLGARWFSHNPGGAIAAVVAATAVGGIVTAPVMARLAASAAFGWRSGWLLLAILSLVGAVLAIVLVRDRSSPTLDSRPDSDVPEPARDDPWPLARVFRTAPFYALSLGAMGLSATNSFMLAHALVHLSDLGRTAGDQANWLSVFTILQFVTICVVGAVGRRTGMRIPLAASLTLQGIGAWLVLDPTSITLPLSAACAGAGFGGAMTALMAIPGEFYGMRAYSRVLGSLMPTLTIAGAVSALGAGWVYDATKAYTAAAIAIDAVVAAAVVTLLIVRRPTPA